MARRNNTDLDGEKQVVADFISVVFPDMDPGENTVFWASPKPNPGFPISRERFDTILQRGGGDRAYYFGSSTIAPDSDGNLRNRQSQFKGFYVLVLDDVGTGPGSKISPKQLPEGLRGRYTYRIETSPGNEQWGYVLDSPIEDLAVAKEFQRAIIRKSGADGGGCMPNKLVRLPGGVNLKAKYADKDGKLFRVWLPKCHDDRLCTPEQLLEWTNVGKTYDEIKEAAAKGGVVHTQSGTTPYRLGGSYHSNLDGLVDPVTEWLAKVDLIANEGGEWIDVLCPWRSEHTEGGGDTAGYNPIGQGARPTTRGFHCFHDSCNGRGINEFLAHVLEEGGPRSSRHGTVDRLLARYAFIAQDNAAIDMKADGLLTVPHQGFKNSLSGDVWVPDSKGNMTAVNVFTLWSKDPARVVFEGRRHDTGGARVLEGEKGGRPWLNTWALPEWGRGAFEMSQVQPFIDFIEYLMPQGEDADWFLNHLAAKAQNVKYRGPGVFMYTSVEGTGRGTLGVILKKLWGQQNVCDVTLSELVSGASSSDFNGWVTRDWVIVPEAKETDMTAKKEHTVYESLKKYIEPGASSVMLKEKYLADRFVQCYGSILICSNHSDALPIDSGGTRFRRIANTINKWGAPRFNALYDWIGSGFEPHVWRWLLARDVSSLEPFARQREISIEEELENALSSGRAIDSAAAICIAFAEAHLGGLVLVSDCISWLHSLVAPLGLDRINRGDWVIPLRRELRRQSAPLLNYKGVQWRIEFGKGRRPRGTTKPEGIELATCVGAVYPDPEQEGLMEAAQEYDLELTGAAFVRFASAKIEAAK